MFPELLDLIHAVCQLLLLIAWGEACIMGILVLIFIRLRERRGVERHHCKTKASVYPETEGHGTDPFSDN